jgi:hypothetical protein
VAGRNCRKRLHITPRDAALPFPGCGSLVAKRSPHMHAWHYHPAVVPENFHPARIRAIRQNQRIILRDAYVSSAAWDVCRQPVKSRRRLEVENLFLRHQLNIALRGAPHRLRLRGSDRALLVWMTWLWPSLLGLSRVVQPDTILRWHRAGFRAYWRWKSRGRPGRPRVSRELREHPTDEQGGPIVGRPAHPW